MLPASTDVEGLFLGGAGKPGLLESIGAGTLVIDSSTIAAATSRKVAGRAPPASACRSMAHGGPAVLQSLPTTCRMMVPTAATAGDDSRGRVTVTTSAGRAGPSQSFRS